MLKLKNITKIYEVGDLRQVALDDVSLEFRKSEFASILGPSGSGKTTLLNIIGGLDKYNSGDLIISNISTEKYKDSDWDSYRNHRIGFVFQSYNLISHQTVLQNVVLALTLSGISKKEGIERAKKALDDVGLSDHIYKKPNQLSGGQMQRVAIARALVNDPEILLADEPTGALDSNTSVQIMKILKDISKNKLVIMVTHNPDLAKEYSNRIINLKDGKIISDTNPYNERKSKEKLNEKTKKTSMSFFTALSLSFNNLMTKKGRTILVALAGSIGIIGIALILALSTGFQAYIDKLQEDTLSSYPLTITNETADMTAMLLSMMSNDKSDDGSNKVKEQQFVSSMFSNVSTNDLKSFKKYIEENQNKINKDVSSIKYQYSIDPLIYTTNPKGEIEKVNPNSMFSSMYGTSGVSSLYSSYTSIFSQMIDDKETLNEQYDVLAGSWPKKYDEMVIVLSEPNAISDLLVYFLGLRDINELYDVIAKVMSGEEVDLNNEPMEFTYEQLMDIELKLVNATDIYKYNSKYEIYEDMSEDKDYIKKLYNKSLKLKIVGVVCAKEGTTSMALSPGIAYTSSLTDYIIDTASKTEIVKKQLNNPDINVFSNTRFDSEKNKTDLNFEDMISIDKKMLESAFNIKIDENELKETTSNYMNEISDSITTDTSKAYDSFLGTLEKLTNGIFSYYTNNPKKTIVNPLDESTLILIEGNEVNNIVNEYFSLDENKRLLKELENTYVIPSDKFEKAYSVLIGGLLKAYIDGYTAYDKTYTEDEKNPVALIVDSMIEPTISMFLSQADIIGTANSMADLMTKAVMQKAILTKVGELTNTLMGSIASSFNVDPDKISKAFKFNLSEEELTRIMSAMVSKNDGSSATSNLINLGYQDKDSPTMIQVYFNSFDSKENFLDFIDKYNKKMEKDSLDDKVIRYTDTTGILMGSVKKIVNSVSYALIAFVSISLVVSSIMIGIITYISVLERTKEIGILRAIGASKKNISSIFNAETFITGLLSGLMGIMVALICIPIINYTIHKLTGNLDINAFITVKHCVLLILLSIILTIIGGLIPSKKASKQDPVIALRTE